MTDKMLAAFAAARRTGSFSAAAWDLSATQQSVSYTIKKLEEELGFPLFVRRASRVECTAGGEQFYAWYAALDSGAAGLAARFPGGVPTGTVTDNQVRCFLTAARLGRVSDAAQAMFYSPQNLLANLNALERALGVELFRAERDAVALTEAGQAYANFFEEASASLRSVKSYAIRDYEARKATALIGVSEWLDIDALDRVLADFPGDRELCAMTNQELLESLESGEADAALWSEGHAPVNRGFDMTAVGREELCLFLPEDGRPCPLLICPGWPRSFLENRAISTQEMSFEGFRPTATVLTDSLDDLIDRLAAGGAAAVGDRRFGRFSAIPGLKTLPLGGEGRVVACRLANASDDCAARLIEHMKAGL